MDLRVSIFIVLFLFGSSCADSQGLMNATDYKWKDIVMDQLPRRPSNNCIKAVEFCTGFSYDMEYSLLYDDQQRTSACSDDYQCLTNHEKYRRKRSCTPMIAYRINKFFCYKYDASDNEVPPISKSCAMRLWRCIKPNLPFYDLIPATDKQQMCENGIVDRCFPWWYSLPVYKYSLETIKGIEDYMCGQSNVSYPWYTDYQEYIVRCYGDRFDLFRILMKLKSYNKQHYHCGQLKECLAATAYVKDWDCGLHEAKVVDELMCSGTSFTPDKYGLFRVSDQCKESFYTSCYNHTILDLETDIELRKTVCRTRTRSLDDCLSESPCNLPEDITTLGKFLCFSLDDPVLRLHDGCVYNFLGCYWIAGNDEGLSYLEMNDNVHLKSMLCSADDGGDDLRRCLKKRISKTEVGCSKTELKIVHDFLCDSCFYETSCTSYRNHWQLYSKEIRQDANATHYKWHSFVQSQSPTISESCMKMFLHCFGLTFQEFLFNYDDKRNNICKGKEGRKCLEHRNPGLQKLCSRIELFRIQMFFCYKYNLTDNEIPPISIPCLMRYWQCSKVGIPFVERIPVAHREKMCKNDIIFNDCTSCLWDTRFEKQAFIVQSYFCNETTTIKPLFRASYLCLQECYAINFDLFKLLSDIKSLNEQNYLCGHQEECLVSAYKREGIDADIVCQREEAKAIDEFMCSNTAFTPNRLGVFMVSDKCRQSFKDDCYNYTVSYLAENAETREEVCRERNITLNECLQKSLCEITQDSKYLGDFLCFDENQPILKITHPCIRQFRFCYGISSEEGFSYLEMNDNLNKRTEFCDVAEKRKCLLLANSDTDDGCNENEVAIINNHFCGSGSDIVIRKSSVVAFLVCEMIALSVALW